MRRQPRGLYCLNILYGALLMLNIPCPTWQNTQPQHPNVAITVFRGTRGDSDRVYICPTKTDTELDSRYIESKTMNCSNAKEEVCDQNGGASCVCQGNNPIYIVNRRRCVNNVWLRQGCVFRFGSWRHSTGWIWNGEDDPLLSLFLDDGYGIAGGFNASSTAFEWCRLANITVLTKTGDWGKIDYDPRDVTIFTQKQHYHIIWNTENLDTESKKQIRGRVLKFSIKCQSPEPTLHNDIFKDPTESCLVFRATGNFTVTPEEFPTDKSESTEDNTTAIALGVTFSILLLAGILIAVVCYRRRTSSSNIAPRFLSNFMSKIR